MLHSSCYKTGYSVSCNLEPFGAENVLKDITTQGWRTLKENCTSLYSSLQCKITLSASSIMVTPCARWFWILNRVLFQTKSQLQMATPKFQLKKKNKTKKNPPPLDIISVFKNHFCWCTLRQVSLDRKCTGSLLILLWFAFLSLSLSTCSLTAKIASTNNLRINGFSLTSYAWPWMGTNFSKWLFICCTFCLKCVWRLNCVLTFAVSQKSWNWSC